MINAKHTETGRELYKTLYNASADEALSLDEYREAVSICSLLSRHCKTYAGIQEAYCNIANFDASKREEHIEKRVEALARALPSIVIERVDFCGDPRGYTVKIHCADSRYNTWGARKQDSG